ncbi:MAG: hypothetical protein GXO36_06385 [Chloroflexi bacterium]|nr:hypothetical protein [Chloroflexota bacterium]
MLHKLQQLGLRFYLLVGFLLLPSFPEPSEEGSTVSNRALLQHIYAHYNRSYKSNGLSFAEFMEVVKTQRMDVDINRDGKPEILISGDLPFSWWTFFGIYHGEGSSLKELYFVEQHGAYAAQARYTYQPPYIILTMWTHWGGTGVHVGHFDKYIIRCEGDQCDAVKFLYYYEGFAWNEPEVSKSRRFASFQVKGDRIEIWEQGYSMERHLKTYEACSPTGKMYFVSEMPETYTVEPRVYKTYSWEHDHFIETDYRELLAYDVRSSSELYERFIDQWLLSLAGENATPEEQINVYYDFFGVPPEKRHEPMMPCHRFKQRTEFWQMKEPEWFPREIAATYQPLDEGGLLEVAINNECYMATWKVPPLERNIQSLDDIDFLDRRELEGCTSSYLGIQWFDITPSPLPELIVVSGFWDQTMWIFDFGEGDTVKLIFKVTGQIRDESFQGAQLYRKNGQTILKVGRVRNAPLHSIEELERYQSEKFDIYLWDNNLQRFVLQKPSPKNSPSE